MTIDLTRPLRPVAFPSPRPWAGTRLGEGIGERWLAGPDSVVALYDGTSPTLDALAATHGAALVGSRGIERLGARFPLLVKLIDAAEWLSLQVHPSDDLARRLYGSDAVGKAEAWVILATDPDTRLVTGPNRDLAPEAILAAIRAGTTTAASDSTTSRHPSPSRITSPSMAVTTSGVRPAGARSGASPAARISSRKCPASSAPPSIRQAAPTGTAWIVGSTAARASSTWSGRAAVAGRPQSLIRNVRSDGCSIS